MLTNHRLADVRKKRKEEVPQDSLYLLHQQILHLLQPPPHDYIILALLTYWSFYFIFKCSVWWVTIVIIVVKLVKFE